VFWISRSLDVLGTVLIIVTGFGIVYIRLEINAQFVVSTGTNISGSKSKNTLSVVRRRRQDGGPDAGTPLPPLQPMERPAKNALERGGESNGMESGQMPTRASL